MTTTVSDVVVPSGVLRRGKPAIARIAHDPQYPGARVPPLNPRMFLKARIEASCTMSSASARLRPASGRTGRHRRGMAQTPL